MLTGGTCNIFIYRLKMNDATVWQMNDAAVWAEPAQLYQFENVTGVWGEEPPTRCHKGQIRGLVRQELEQVTCYTLNMGV